MKPVVSRVRGLIVLVECSACEGEGKVPFPSERGVEDCVACEGSGKVRGTATLKEIETFVRYCKAHVKLHRAKLSELLK